MSSRRTFLTATAAGLTAAIPQKSGANDRIRVAVLGVNGRGKDLAYISGIQKQSDAEVVMLCDPDMQVAEKTASDFAKKYGRTPRPRQDLRKVFDHKDVDVVSVATPNHWHSLATIWACQAGKDVYVEKPGSHNIFEGRKMVEAAKKYNRIVQHGVQLRSSEAVQRGRRSPAQGADRQGLHGARPGLPRPALDRPRQGPGHPRRRR